MPKKATRQHPSRSAFVQAKRCSKSKHTADIHRITARSAAQQQRHTAQCSCNGRTHTATKAARSRKKGKAMALRRRSHRSRRRGPLLQRDRHPVRRPRHRTMFDRIAPHYDKANDFMSLGLHHGWREALIAGLDISRMTMRWTSRRAPRTWRSCKENAARPFWVLTLPKHVGDWRGKVTEAGLDRRRKVGARRRHLPDSSIPRSTTRSRSASGIRNIPDIDSALREMRRVARPGALLGVLEFALPERPPRPSRAPSFQWLQPVLCAVLSGAGFDEDAHLARSIAGVSLA